MKLLLRKTHLDLLSDFNTNLLVNSIDKTKFLPLKSYDTLSSQIELVKDQFHVKTIFYKFYTIEKHIV